MKNNRSDQFWKLNPDAVSSNHLTRVFSTRYSNNNNPTENRPIIYQSLIICLVRNYSHYARIMLAR